MLDHQTAEFKTYLKSLSTRELIKLADFKGIDIPPDLDRVFIIRELLDNAFDEEIPPILDLSEVADLKTAALPEQYHISYLEVLPRDPQWVYVFWEIKAQDRERCEGDQRFSGYALKIQECKTPGAYIDSFSVPVNAQDNSRYLTFSRAGIFRIAFWVQGLETALIFSESFALPRFLNNPANEEYLSSPLIQLCNAEDFAILRDSDRISRCRHG